MNTHTFLNKFQFEDKPQIYNNPVWHIHYGLPPSLENEITFNTLMNLVGVCNSSDKNVIWGFVKEYNNNLDPKSNQSLDKLIGYAINYYIDFILPNKKYLKIDKENKIIFEDLYQLLINIDKKSTSEEIQTEIYEIGKKHNFSNLREFFKLIYQVLLGQNQGPRLGSFIKVFGIDKTCDLIQKTLNQKN